MKEIWKDIEEYEGKYQVSNLGRVKSLLFINGNIIKKREKILKELGENKYLHVTLWKNHKGKNYSVHQLVAKAFIENPNNYKEINHKDENIRNNKADNLEWCDHKYNINYGTRTKKVKEKMQVSVVQYDLNGNFIKEWDCMNDAIRFYNNKHIVDVCKGKRISANNYIWKYDILDK